MQVRVQKGEVASTPEEAEKVAERLLKAGAKELVIKAQVHAGGRGKGHFTNGFKGGVKITSDPKAIREYASKMIGSSLITAQTGPEGQPCKQVRRRYPHSASLLFSLSLSRCLMSIKLP